MKKLILKTAFITFGVTLVLAVSLFGIVSFCAPAAMMRFCESLGLENIGGDYAYQEYQNSRKIDYLAYSFEMAAQSGSYSVAGTRFEELYGSEEDGAQRKQFGEFCLEQSEKELVLPDGIDSSDIPSYGYRNYICGLAARVKYHLAQTDDEKAAACAFAISESAVSLSPDSPVFALALEVIGAKDGEFAGQFLLPRVRGGKFDAENVHYQNLVKFLEAVNEQ